MCMHAQLNRVIFISAYIYFCLFVCLFAVAWWFVRQVFQILGMSKEAQADVFETFDAELFALSRLNTKHIVKVRY